MSLLATRRPGSLSASAAAPRPTIPSTFSNPPRRARSCAPPTTKGFEADAAANYERAYAGGPPNLWALKETRSAPSASISRGTWPDCCRGVDVDRHSSSSTKRNDLVHRLHGPDLVVAPLAVDERRPIGFSGGEERLKVVEIDPPAAVYLEHRHRPHALGRLADARVLHVRTDHRRAGLAAPAA